MDDSIATSPSAGTVSRPRGSAVTGGRLTMYAALGALTWSLPIPLLPDALGRRVRGALVFDIAARHGLSLTREARDILAEPAGAEGPRSMLTSAAQYVGLRVINRLGPMSFAGRFLGPVRTALSTWALGYLFDRYVERARTEAAVRIDVDEARRVRLAVDRALAHVLTAEGRPDDGAAAPEDLRDTTTRVVDTVLGTVASAPSWLLRRLDAAFDELMPARTA